MIGIYEIHSNKTGKCYIGSSINVSQRWTKHRSELRLGQHQCKPLQAEYNADAELIYRMIETCAVDELEEKEAFYIGESDCYNTSQKTGTAMRDKEVSARAVASRLDQSGMNANGVTASKESYLKVFHLLSNGKSSYEVASIVTDISRTAIRRIAGGATHHWLRDEDPERYELMLRCGVEEEAKSTKSTQDKQYQLRHKKGDEFTGSRAEISEKLEIDPKMVEKLLKKKLIFVKGWKLATE